MPVMDRFTFFLALPMMVVLLGLTIAAAVGLVPVENVVALLGVWAAIIAAVHLVR